MQIVTGQGVIKKVQFSYTQGVAFMPTPYDTSNSELYDLFSVFYKFEFFSYKSACRYVC
jgi:hypothetical protein